MSYHFREVVQIIIYCNGYNEQTKQFDHVRHEHVAKIEGYHYVVSAWDYRSKVAVVLMFQIRDWNSNELLFQYRLDGHRLRLIADRLYLKVHAFDLRK